MKKILNFLINPIVISAIGLILIALLIWYGGPAIKFGEDNSAPLEGQVTRLLCIKAIVVLWGLNNLRIQMRNNKSNRELVQDLEENQAQQQKSAEGDQASEENEAVEDKPHRRIQDAITSKTPTRKMNLDRRYKNSERRCLKDSGYKGWARRFTVDRRKTAKDRRKLD